LSKWSSFGAWLLWIAVLAVLLMHERVRGRSLEADRPETP
jgi:hypothetical protein